MSNQQIYGNVRRRLKRLNELVISRGLDCSARLVSVVNGGEAYGMPPDLAEQIRKYVFSRRGRCYLIANDICRRLGGPYDFA